MPGQYNTGHDVSLDFVGPTGPISFSYITEFDAHPMSKMLESDCIDGITRRQVIWNGWGGTVGIDRANRNVDDVVYALEQIYYGGQVEVKATITQTIKETDGSISQWRFSNVTLEIDNLGKWSKDAKVTQQIKWTAEGRQKVA